MMTYKEEVKCPYTNSTVERAFGEEVNLFMHCHMRGYDKEGEGKQLHSDYYDQYGAPVDLFDSWSEGYHIIEKLLASLFEISDYKIMDFPLVAGVAGGVHLYKPLHSEKPWNWTGWVPLQRRWLTEGKFISNRYFLSIRGNEIQNNLWDYHPQRELQLVHEETDEMEISQYQPIDKYRGGYFFKGNPFGRYLHVMTIKEHKVDSYLGKPRRYNYIVHPLAYRGALNDIPDNGVDAMQWCIINIKNEKHFGPSTDFGECHALEIFNDFTFSHSYAPESSDTCYNGTLIPGKYIYWFDTYPLEYAEFLLDSALARGVYLHTLTSNDAFYKKIAEFDPEKDPDAEEKLRKHMSDPKDGLKVSQIKRTKGARHQTVVTRTEKKLRDQHSTREEWEKFRDFVLNRPYGFQTVFAYTTLIDTERKIRNAIFDRPVPGTGIDDAEVHALNYLLEGNFYASLGINGVFDYTNQPVPYVIKNQPDPKRMCYKIDEKKEMDLVFTFAQCKKKISIKRLIWRYTIMCETEDKTLETAHGYFKLSSKKKTILNLNASYELNKVKWLYFVAIDSINPMKRAWFHAIKGPAFGMPETPAPSTSEVDGLIQGLQEHLSFLTPSKVSSIGSRVVSAVESYYAGDSETYDYSCVLPDLKHRIFYTKKERGLKRIITQGDEFYPEAYESKDLDFTFDKCATGNDDICVYFLQVCPHVPDIKIPQKTENSSRKQPPRISQSVHGFFLMHSEYPTRLKLSNSWDKDTVKEERVYFYDISAASGQPIKTNK